ncbi:MAG TPA: NADH-quinone oxidoreductase subunit J [Candidatus Kryptonia bacterium]|nr:NADH-quinone oxidoreductase subunit J [Candidatus Kryptonia bacterium]
MSLPLFAVLAALLVASALGVILQRNPVRSALALVTTLFLLAVVFIFLEAHLVALLQIVVYAGAIMVLFLFVIMLLNLQNEPPEIGRIGLRFAAAAAGSLFALQLVWVARAKGVLAGAGMAGGVGEAFGTTTALGEKLFTQYLLPFEITSLVLLVAIIGSVVLAKRHVS